MVLYNMLPRGFLKEKLAIRKALMKKEQEVSSFVDKYVITGASEEVRRAYHALMKYIALFNMHLEANSFQLASTTYRRILQLLNKLPYGIITRSKLLMQELKEVAREARILRLFKRIQSSVSQSNRETAKRYVTEARLELSKLDQTQPQVIGLYRYLNHIILKSKQSGTPIFKGIKLPKQATVEQPITRQITKEQLLKEFQNSIKQLEQEKKPKSELQELKPLTKEQEEEVNRIANRELSGELKDEQFNKLNELLQKELTKGIAENKNEKLSNNLKMARMFIELGDKQKAKEFLEKVLAAEPGNKIAEALLNQLKVS